MDQAIAIGQIVTSLWCVGVLVWVVAVVRTVRRANAQLLDELRRSSTPPARLASRRNGNGAH